MNRLTLAQATALLASHGITGSLGVVGNRAVLTVHMIDGEVWADSSVHDTFDHFPRGADGKFSRSAIEAYLGY